MGNFLGLSGHKRGQVGARIPNLVRKEPGMIRKMTREDALREKRRDARGAVVGLVCMLVSAAVIVWGLVLLING